jgi:lysophospholipase L1-like esterase
MLDTKMTKKILGRVSALAIVMLGLYGCGGSSGGSFVPPPPPPPPPPPANVAPTANAGLDQTVDSGVTVTLNGGGSTDSDGTVASYAWTQNGGTAVVLDETAPSMPTFIAPNVPANEVLTFDLIVTDDDGAASAVDSVDITVGASLPLPFTDDFSDGNSDGWTTTDDGISNASSWSVSGGSFVQATSTNDFGGDVTESYRRGTYAHLDASNDLTNYRLSVDVAAQSGSDDDMGIMFRYTDDDNYYRFTINSEAGGSRLESKVNGTFMTLAHNFRGYRPNSLHAIDIEAEGSLIQVYDNGNPLFAVSDSDHLTGGVALYARDGIRFDNVSITTNDPAPAIVIASPTADNVIPNAPRNIVISAVARNIPAAGSVDLEVVGLPACAPVTETSPGVFEGTCPNVASGNYSVRATLRDGGAQVSQDTNQQVAVGDAGIGDKFDAIGDSLTLGFLDQYRTDNLALSDPRVLSFQGWAGPLSDMLTTTNGQPNLVANEGVPGDTVDRIRNLRLESIIDRNDAPRSNRALVMIGTNDANDSRATPSGLGCAGAACDDTYNGLMRSIITRLQLAGRTDIMIATLPPTFGETQTDIYGDPLAQVADPTTRISRVVGYNDVVTTELTALAGVTQGPDLYTCFLTATSDRFSLFEDSLHPNGLGYALIAALWHDAITGPPVVTGLATCPSPIYIVEGLDPYTHGLKQNLLEEGDGYYTDTNDVLTNVPPELEGGVWISQANADNENTDASFMSFDVGSSAVTVYVAYDGSDGGVAPSSSVALGAAALTGNLSVSDGAVGNMTVVSAAGVTGVVTLGGTHSGAVTAGQKGYVVIVVP